MKPNFLSRVAMGYDKDINQMPLMVDKMFKYIMNFSLRFTECCYEII